MSAVWKLGSDRWSGRMPDNTCDTLPQVSRLRPETNSQLYVQRTLQQLSTGKIQKSISNNLIKYPGQHKNRSSRDVCSIDDSKMV